MNKVVQVVAVAMFAAFPAFGADGEEAGETQATETAAEDAATNVVAGDVKKGKRVFKRCKACHSLKEADNKVGPSLYNIVGAEAGAVEGFRYSNAILESGWVWDPETLTLFLANPREALQGNKMTFAGLKKQSEIDDLIAYLLDEQTQ